MNTTRCRGQLCTGRRAGSFLIEALLVTTLSGIITVSAIKVVMRLISLENNASQALEDARNMRQFYADLRSDLHQARNVELSEEGTLLTLTCHDGGRIFYRHREGLVWKERPLQTQFEPARQAWPTMAGLWTFEVDQQARLVTITRERKPVGRSGPMPEQAPRQTEQLSAAWGVLVPVIPQAEPTASSPATPDAKAAPVPEAPSDSSANKPVAPTEGLPPAPPLSEPVSEPEPPTGMSFDFKSPSAGTALSGGLS